MNFKWSVILSLSASIEAASEAVCLKTDAGVRSRGTRWDSGRSLWIQPLGTALSVSAQLSCCREVMSGWSSVHTDSLTSLVFYMLESVECEVG